MKNSTFTDRHFRAAHASKRSAGPRLALVSIVLFACHAAIAQTGWRELTDAGHKAFQQQQYAEAAKYFKAALKEAQRFPGKDPRRPESLDNMAEVERAQNHSAEAEKLYYQSLAIREKTLGPWHLQVAQSLDNLADLLTAQHNSTKAEPLFERARKIRERALAEHPDMYVDGQPKPVQKLP